MASNTGDDVAQPPPRLSPSPSPAPDPRPGPCSQYGGCSPELEASNSDERLEFKTDVADITCSCGFGYFKPDGTWVSGDRVRSGQAPLKPKAWSAEEIEAGKEAFAAQFDKT